MRFKMAAICCIFEHQIIDPCIALGWWFSITVPNLVQKFWSTPKLWPKTKFKMATAAIFYLFPVATFNILPTTDYRSQHTYRISCQYLNSRLNYKNFLKFKMAAVRHVVFSKTWLLTHTSPWTVDFPSWYQMWCPKSKFKMAAVRRPGFP